MPEIETVGYNELQRWLKKYEPQLRKDLNKELRVVAGKVAAIAKTNAAAIPSTRIPGAITTMVTARGAGVRVRRKQAPHGSLLELGSKGNRGTIRHPFFGNRNVWYSQPTKPFLRPAVEQEAPRMRREIEALLITSAKRAGF